MPVVLMNHVIRHTVTGLTGNMSNKNNGIRYPHRFFHVTQMR